MAAMLLMIVLALVAWTVLGALLVSVPLGRYLARRDGRHPAPLRLSSRGRWAVLLAVAVLAGLALAIFTRGQHVTWFGLEPLPTSAVTR